MPVGRATPLVEPIECVATIEVTYPKVLGKLLFPDEPVPHWIVNPVELSRAHPLVPLETDQLEVFVVTVS